MGLDMYMNTYPRYKNLSVTDLCKVDNYFAYKDKAWFDKADTPSDEVIGYFQDKVKTSHPEWDTEKRYPRVGISEEVAYWRKANAIHKYFVEKVQDGNDDCGSYEVKKEVVEELMQRCKTILEACIMTPGKIANGAKLSDGKWEPIIEDGLTIANKAIAEKLLPTQDGFFFGDTQYDQYYMEDIAYTYRLCYRLLQEVDFEKQMLVYCSSW